LALKGCGSAADNRREGVFSLDQPAAATLVNFILKKSGVPDFDGPPLLV